jgi:hypothetical protein
MRNRTGTSMSGVAAHRGAWRGWAGPLRASITDVDLATALDRRYDVECGLRTPRRWRRLRW